jgi:hypothetical protein
LQYYSEVQVTITHIPYLVITTLMLAQVYTAITEQLGSLKIHISQHYHTYPIKLLMSSCICLSDALQYLALTIYLTAMRNVGNCEVTIDCDLSTGQPHWPALRNKMNFN